MRNFCIIVCFIVASCTSKNETKESIEAQAPEAISFSGKQLYAPASDSVALAKSDSTIAAIKAKGELTEDDYIAIGQQLIGVGRYNDAIIIYSEGLDKFTGSFKLLRHRGHRYISIRKLDDAIKDLNKAEELIRDQPDVLEYDAAGHTTGTYQHWIWYHIGLYYFLNQAYIQAAPAYEKCLAASRNNKNIVGSSDWLYNTYMRLGKTEEAKKLLDPIGPNFDTDQEHPYFRRVMLYKGVITPAELVDVNQDPAKTSVQDVTKMYGLTNWYGYQGEQEKAISLYQKIVQSESGWPGFAFAAAEKELANLESRSK